jgi:ankyrin repeat protein
MSSETKYFIGTSGLIPEEDHMRIIKKSLILSVILVIFFMPIMAEDIHEAVKKGNPDLVKAILAENPELINARGEYGRTPLMQAAFSRQEAVFKYLVEKGADVNLSNKEGFGPLHFTTLFGARELVELLISKGAQINSNTNVIGVTPLHLAASRGHKDVVELLISKGALLNVKDRRGNTPLLSSVLGNHKDIVKLLLAKGASINEKDQIGSTPLLLAALNGQKDMVEFLISKGANINAQNSRGSTPVSVAAREGHQEIVDLLIARGAKKEFIKQPILEGEYLGQKKPGLTPELFAPGIVSTEKRELNSVFTPDGKEFYFTVRTGPMKWKIMVMKQENNRWTTPRVASFSGLYSDVDLFISPDGKRLFYCSNRPLEGKGEPKKDFDIWVVERIKGGWSEPLNLGAPINSEEAEFYPSVTRDGTMYFQSMRSDSIGARDIYRSKPVNGVYEKVENVGDVINSELFEGDVLISPGEDYMIFSVNRPDSFGQGDLYISFRDKKNNWTTPKNMRNKINTEHNENCPILSPDGKFFFFTRHNDIFWVDAGVIQKLKNKK